MSLTEPCVSLDSTKPSLTDSLDGSIASLDSFVYKRKGLTEGYIVEEIIQILCRKDLQELLRIKSYILRQKDSVSFPNQILVTIVIFKTLDLFLGLLLISSEFISRNYYNMYSEFVTPFKFYISYI